MLRVVLVEARRVNDCNAYLLQRRKIGNYLTWSNLLFGVSLTCPERQKVQGHFVDAAKLHCICLSVQTTQTVGVKTQERAARMR